MSLFLKNLPNSFFRAIVSSRPFFNKTTSLFPSIAANAHPSGRLPLLVVSKAHNRSICFGNAGEDRRRRCGPHKERGCSKKTQKQKKHISSGAVNLTPIKEQFSTAVGDGNANEKRETKSPKEVPKPRRKIMPKYTKGGIGGTRHSDVKALSGTWVSKNCIKFDFSCKHSSQCKGEGSKPMKLEDQGSSARYVPCKDLSTEVSQKKNKDSCKNPEEKTATKSEEKLDNQEEETCKKSEKETTTKKEKQYKKKQHPTKHKNKGKKGKKCKPCSAKKPKKDATRKSDSHPKRKSDESRQERLAQAANSALLLSPYGQLTDIHVNQIVEKLKKELGDCQRSTCQCLEQDEDGVAEKKGFIKSVCDGIFKNKPPAKSTSAPVVKRKKEEAPTRSRSADCKVDLKPKHCEKSEKEDKNKEEKSDCKKSVSCSDHEKARDKIATKKIDQKKTKKKKATPCEYAAPKMTATTGAGKEENKKIVPCRKEKDDKKESKSTCSVPTIRSAIETSSSSKKEDPKLKQATTTCNKKNESKLRVIEECENKEVLPETSSDRSPLMQSIALCKKKKKVDRPQEGQGVSHRNKKPVSSGNKIYKKIAVLNEEKEKEDGKKDAAKIKTFIPCKYEDIKPGIRIEAGKKNEKEEKSECDESRNEEEDVVKPCSSCPKFKYVCPDKSKEDKCRDSEEKSEKSAESSSIEKQRKLVEKKNQDIATKLDKQKTVPEERSSRGEKKSTPHKKPLPPCKYKDIKKKCEKSSTVSRGTEDGIKIKPSFIEQKSSFGSQITEDETCSEAVECKATLSVPREIQFDTSKKKKSEGPDQSPLMQCVVLCNKKKKPIKPTQDRTGENEEPKVLKQATELHECEKLKEEISHEPKKIKPCRKEKGEEEETAKSKSVPDISNAAKAKVVKHSKSTELNQKRKDGEKSENNAAKKPKPVCMRSKTRTKFATSNKYGKQPKCSNKSEASEKDKTDREKNTSKRRNVTGCSLIKPKEEPTERENDHSGVEKVCPKTKRPERDLCKIESEDLKDDLKCPESSLKMTKAEDQTKSEEACECEEKECECEEQECDKQSEPTDAGRDKIKEFVPCKYEEIKPGIRKPEDELGFEECQDKSEDMERLEDRMQDKKGQHEACQKESSAFTSGKEQGSPRTCPKFRNPCPDFQKEEKECKTEDSEFRHCKDGKLEDPVKISPCKNEDLNESKMKKDSYEETRKETEGNVKIVIPSECDTIKPKIRQTFEDDKSKEYIVKIFVPCKYEKIKPGIRHQENESEFEECLEESEIEESKRGALKENEETSEDCVAKEMHFKDNNSKEDIVKIFVPCKYEKIKPGIRHPENESEFEECVEELEFEECVDDSEQNTLKVDGEKSTSEDNNSKEDAVKIFVPCKYEDIKPGIRHPDNSLDFEECTEELEFEDCNEELERGTLKPVDCEETAKEAVEKIVPCVYDTKTGIDHPECDSKFEKCKEDSRRVSHEEMTEDASDTKTKEDTVKIFPCENEKIKPNESEFDKEKKGILKKEDCKAPSGNVSQTRKNNDIARAVVPCKQEENRPSVAELKFTKSNRNKKLEKDFKRRPKDDTKDKHQRKEINRTSEKYSLHHRLTLKMSSSDCGKVADKKQHQNQKKDKTKSEGKNKLVRKIFPCGDDSSRVEPSNTKITNPANTSLVIGPVGPKPPQSAREKTIMEEIEKLKSELKELKTNQLRLSQSKCSRGPKLDAALPNPPESAGFIGGLLAFLKNICVGLFPPKETSAKQAPVRSRSEQNLRKKESGTVPKKSKSSEAVVDSTKKSKIEDKGKKTRHGSCAFDLNPKYCDKTIDEKKTLKEGEITPSKSQKKKSEELEKPIKPCSTTRCDAPNKEETGKMIKPCRHEEKKSTGIAAKNEETKTLRTISRGKNEEKKCGNFSDQSPIMECIALCLKKKKANTPQKGKVPARDKKLCVADVKTLEKMSEKNKIGARRKLGLTKPCPEDEDNAGESVEKEEVRKKTSESGPSDQSPMMECAALCRKRKRADTPQSSKVPPGSKKSCVGDVDALKKVHRLKNASNRKCEENKDISSSTCRDESHGSKSVPTLIQKSSDCKTDFANSQNKEESKTIKPCASEKNKSMTNDTTKITPCPSEDGTGNNRREETESSIKPCPTEETKSFDAVKTDKPDKSQCVALRIRKKNTNKPRRRKLRRRNYSTKTERNTNETGKDEDIQGCLAEEKERNCELIRPCPEEEEEKEARNEKRESSSLDVVPQLIKPCPKDEETSVGSRKKKGKPLVSCRKKRLVTCRKKCSPRQTKKEERGRAKHIVTCSDKESCAHRKPEIEECAENRREPQEKNSSICKALTENLKNLMGKKDIGRSESSPVVSKHGRKCGSLEISEEKVKKASSREKSTSDIKKTASHCDEKKHKRDGRKRDGPRKIPAPCKYEEIKSTKRGEDSSRSQIAEDKNVKIAPCRKSERDKQESNRNGSKSKTRISICKTDEDKKRTETKSEDRESQHEKKTKRCDEQKQVLFIRPCPLAADKKKEENLTKKEETEEECEKEK